MEEDSTNFWTSVENKEDEIKRLEFEVENTEKRKQFLREQINKVIYELPINNERKRKTKEFLRKKRLRKLSDRSRRKNLGR